MANAEFQPKRVLITRDGADNVHERMQREPGLIMGNPHVGESLHLFLETGKMMTTSPVIKVANKERELIVDTQNSRYHLKLAS